LSDHTCSVKPAAIAGVHGRHIFAKPRPLVALGSASAWRKLAWGHCQVNEKSLPDAFLRRKAEGMGIAKIKGFVKAQNPL
jgi:hypothetical protein